MKNYKIAVIAGDGIGPEVIAEGVKILNAAAKKDGTFSFSFTYFPWGCEFYKETGKMMDDDGIEQLGAFDAIFLGAVGAPGVPDHISLWGLLLSIRKGFDQYINLRPVKLLRGAPTPIKNATEENVDMIFVRENSEGWAICKSSAARDTVPVSHTALKYFSCKRFIAVHLKYII